MGAKKSEQLELLMRKGESCCRSATLRSSSIHRIVRKQSLKQCLEYTRLIVSHLPLDNGIVNPLSRGRPSHLLCPSPPPPMALQRIPTPTNRLHNLYRMKTIGFPPSARRQSHWFRIIPKMEHNQLSRTITANAPPHRHTHTHTYPCAHDYIHSTAAIYSFLSPCEQCKVNN